MLKIGYDIHCIRAFLLNIVGNRAWYTLYKGGAVRVLWKVGACVHCRGLVLSSTVESVKYIVKGRSFINENEESHGHCIKVFLSNIFKKCSAMYIV